MRLGRVGVVAGALALVVAVATVAVGVPAVLAVLASDAVVSGLAVLVAIVGLFGLAGVARNGSETAFPPTSVASVERKRIGSTIDHALERSGPTETATERRRRFRLRGKSRTAVRETAIAALAERHDVDTSEAVALVHEGAWTDDPRAAAFLGNARLPLRLRIVDWAYGERYARGLESAIDEVERIADGGDIDG